MTCADATSISEVSVHRHEFVENDPVPYATLELPIEVDDFNSNNVFDSGDWLIASTTLRE